MRTRPAVAAAQAPAGWRRPSVQNPAPLACPADDDTWSARCGMSPAQLPSSSGLRADDDRARPSQDSIYHFGSAHLTIGDQAAKQVEQGFRLSFDDLGALG